MFKLSRFVSYIEKNNAYAVYCNFNLFFFKKTTYKWFKQIINNTDIDKINEDFISYLLKNEIIIYEGEKNV